MTVFRSSRFRSSEMMTVVCADGTQLRVHPMQSTAEASESEATYITRAGDTFESLAFKFYGDGNKWYVLANANPEIFWPLDLQPSVEIRVPPVSVAALS